MTETDRKVLSDSCLRLAFFAFLGVATFSSKPEYLQYQMYSLFAQLVLVNLAFVLGDKMQELFFAVLMANVVSGLAGMTLRIWFGVDMYFATSVCMVFVTWAILLGSMIHYERKTYASF